MAHIVFNVSPTLPSFAGKSDENVEEFMSKMDRFFEAVPAMNAAQKLFYLDAQTSGAANKLITRTLDELENDEPLLQIDDQLAVVRRELADAFRQPVDQYRSRQILQSRIKDPSESYPEYIQAVLQLCHELEMADTRAQIREIHKGCPPQIAYVLRPQDFDTVRAFREAIAAVEASNAAVLRAHLYHATAVGLRKPPPCYAPQPTPGGKEATGADDAKGASPSKRPHPKNGLAQCHGHRAAALPH